MRMQPLEPRRVRHPRGAYGWVDLKVITDGCLERLELAEALTYLFLCSVGNTLGISFWSTNRMARVLHLDPGVVKRALEVLVIADLIAWNGRVVQVLPVPECAPARCPDPSLAQPAVAALERAVPGTPAETAEAVLARLAPEERERLIERARERFRRFLTHREPSAGVLAAAAVALLREEEAACPPRS